jgi:hypothetical protein
LTSLLLPGKTIDAAVASCRVRAVSTRMGLQEMQLLADIAQEYGMTRSSLVRRLVVEQLIHLRNGNV